MPDGEYIKAKDLPLIGSSTINPNDKVLCTHVMPDNTRATRAIPVNTLLSRLATYMMGEGSPRRIIFDTKDPDNSIGKQGDIYFKISNSPVTRVVTMYAKYASKWVTYDFKKGG